MAEIKKQELTSMNIKEEQLQKLKQLFPEAFTEGLKVDWEKLRLTLGEDIDTGKERFGMNWPGKSECYKTIQQPSIATLIPAREESINFDTTQNIFIEGDNLEVLKLLQKSYLGKIKVMCIDPPYNSGNDFIYPDNYSENLDTYLAYTGQIDSEGKKFSTNTETDGRFHSKWMNMMYPRLFLAKNLLQDDGVIFISIDDKEIDNLKKICNEIFGEENSEIYIWDVREDGNMPKTAKKTVRKEHEYVVAAYKNKDLIKLNKYEELKYQDNEEWGNPDNDPRGAWMSGNISRNQVTSTTGEKYFEITTPTGRVYARNWTVSKIEFEELLEDNRIYFANDGDGVPRKKIFKDEPVLGIQSSLFENLLSSQSGKKQIKELLGNIDFDYPKPVNLIKRFIQISSSKNSIVLDFFAGSCTTAHAVIETNKEDGGNRKFICVQLPQPTEDGSEAKSAGYNSIAEIGKARIRKQIEKTKQEPPQLFKVDISKLDLGFKVYKLAQSNFKIWDTTLEKSPEVIQAKLFEHIHHISPEAEQEAILYELLLKSGFELTTPIEKLTLAGLIVFSIAEGQLLICLEKQLTHDCLKAMADLHPTRVICLDEAFTGTNADALKTNAVQIMKSKGVVNFRTV